MSTASAFAASVLDTTLSAQAAGVALRLRETLGPEKLAELGRFEEHAGDLRVRLQYLAEALALGHPRIYLQHVEWLREVYLVRGLGEEHLRTTQACLCSVLRADLPPLAWQPVEPILAAEARILATPWREPPSALEGPRGVEAARLLEVLLEGRRAEVLALVEEQVRRLGELEFVERVLVSAQRELGRLWQRGEIHVGEEHLGSRLTEEILMRLSSQGADRLAGKRVVVASTSGDLHEIGARMVAYRLERQGWDVRFLGANVPSDDLSLALQELRPHVLALSVTLGLHLRGAAAIIAQAHALDPCVPVLLGGPALQLDPELWRTLGADGVAQDAVTAEREARRLAAV